MEWTDLGPLPHFDPVISNADVLCVPIVQLKLGMLRLGLTLHFEGDATLVKCDDRPIGDPVYLAPPTRGYMPLRNIVKLFARTQVDYLDVINAVNDVIREAATTSTAVFPLNQAAAGG